MPIYTFECEDGHRTDRFTRSYETTESGCGLCEKVAHRTSVYEVGFSGFARTPPDERGWEKAYNDAQEASAEIQYRHERMEEAAGKRLPQPPLMDAGIKKAKRLRSLGAKDANDA